jgi:hypothetical protein
MQKIILYIKLILLPVIIIWLIALLYHYFIVFFRTRSYDLGLISSNLWQIDGFVLLCSYTLVKLLSKALDFNTVRKRVFVTILLYFVSFAIIAFPFLLASFFQPIQRNVFLHIFIVILIVEISFRIYEVKNET